MACEASRDPATDDRSSETEARKPWPGAPTVTAIDLAQHTAGGTFQASQETDSLHS